jgi:hypothetical protein
LGIEVQFSRPACPQGNGGQGAFSFIFEFPDFENCYGGT